MFRSLRNKFDHKIHETKDHTNVIISAHNRVEGADPSQHQFSARETIVNYKSTTNADLVRNFNLAAIQCGAMSENNMGEISLHSVQFTVEGTINGHVIDKKELNSIAALSELIKSCGIETNYITENQAEPEQTGTRNTM